MKNPFSLIFEVINDPADFKMPYTIYGKNDLEVMADKYNQLNNKPKSLLDVRFVNGKANFQRH
jgi:hypothetical protein